MYSRPVVPGGAGGAPDFGKSVNPISARGADYATTSLLAPPDFQTFLRPCTVTSNYSHEVSITDICWLRLDFESFTLLGTGNTVETDGTTGGGLCLDSFTVSVKKGYL